MKFPRKHIPRGIAMPMTIIAIAAMVLLIIGLITVLTLERKTARSFSDSARAELAAESGIAVTMAQITDFFERTDVTGAAFTTWAYHPGGESTPGSLLALTAGRPQFDVGTIAGAAFLNSDNTEWLAPGDDDPDKLFADFTAGGEDVFDFNARNVLGEAQGLCLARWQTYDTDANGNEIRYAVWVDDESARLDVTQIGTLAREDGNSPAEIPFFKAGILEADIASSQESWRTADTARVFLDDTEFPEQLSDVTTSFSRGYDVIAHAESFADAGASEINGYKLPLRGGAKRNLNWNGHITGGSVNDRVERLTEWMANGARGFFEKRNLNYWVGRGTSRPEYITPDSSNPFASDLRKEQFRTISASLIDYLDADNIPTQPESLAALDFGNPEPGAAPLFLMRDVPRPDYFGADRTIRINEMQIVWNSEGAPDNFEANRNVERTSLGGGLFRYEIPVTYRFELWNMDDNPIPATSYEVRTTYIQQIQGSTFGAIGAQPIPEESELVLPLNSGNPIAFAPNEIKVFNVTRTYTRVSTNDRGTTWSSFRLGGSGTGDDQPDGHQRQAHVLLDTGTGEWLHATNYLAMTQAPTDGVASAGPGNKGRSKGNRLNDPRMTPLRMYDKDSGLHFHEADRDWSSNKPGKMGAVNNSINGNDYQDFNYWLDRPYLQSITNPLQGITRVENRPMFSPAELGRIFDPSWTHPNGRGTFDGPFNEGIFSPFRGGATLAIGQFSKATVSGTEAADHLDAKPWNLLDVFAVEGDGSSMSDEEFGSLEWRGRINLNAQKSFELLDEVKTNHEIIMELPELRFGATDQPDEFNFDAVAEELKGRLTNGWERPDGTVISRWEEAMPLYSPGQLSELESMNETTSYLPAESHSNGELTLLNRNDPAREEAMMRTANLVTTRSHCYRIVAAGEVLSPSGKVLGRKMQEKIIFFNCTWDATTGELESVKPEILYARTL